MSGFFLISLWKEKVALNEYEICLNTTNYPVFNMCKISDIRHAPTCWTLLVMWYHPMYIIWWGLRLEASLLSLYCTGSPCKIVWHGHTFELHIHLTYIQTNHTWFLIYFCRTTFINRSRLPVGRRQFLYCVVGL